MRSVPASITRIAAFTATCVACSTAPGTGADPGALGQAGATASGGSGTLAGGAGTTTTTGGTPNQGGASGMNGSDGAAGSTNPAPIGGTSGGGTHAGQGGAGSPGASGSAGEPASGGASTGGIGAADAGEGSVGGATAGGNAGASTGGVAAGGSSSSGGTGGAPGSSELAEAYPCDGDMSSYDVVVSGSGASWTVSGGSGGEGSFSDLAAALGNAYGRLSANRTMKESVLVLGDGSIDASAQVRLPSYIVLNLCGVIEVTGTASGSDRSPLYARGASDIDIPHAHLTGNPQYGMFFRSVSRLHLGQVTLRQNPDNSGIGIRIDNNPSGGGERVTDIRIDYVDGEGTGSHIVETYGVDGLVIGRVDGRDTGECGVLLNDTANAEVGVVHCEDCATGTGYAAFRIANDAGKLGNEWPAGNIHVGEVYARGGGRGIFSVSGSGGLTIDRIDIADTGNNGILLQNCYNTVIAAESGTVSNADVLLSNDTDNTNDGTFEPSQNVLFSNLTLSNGATVSEAWCDLGDRGNRAENVTGGSVDMCF